ncbi:MAG: hypothetical protein HY914_08445 [Desulfomonile tiedjei]|nr:hypothetical protein [Desulfomonile tiedjei]
MRKGFTILLCALLALALAAPAFADVKTKGKASIPARVYASGAAATDRVAYAATRVLKTSFSVFNPCLDFVKGCTDVVLTPIGKPFDYMEKAMAKRWCPPTAKARPAEKR